MENQILRFVKPPKETRLAWKIEGKIVAFDSASIREFRETEGSKNRVSTVDVFIPL